jgi:S-adenosylmethionine hydrolase
MKGVILGINPDARLVDVTHDIEPFSVIEAALLLKGIARYFPGGSIHVAVVDPEVGSERRGIVLRLNEQLCLGPDNGLFSLNMAKNVSWEARKIENPELTLPAPHPTFHGRDVFAPVAAHLSIGKPLDDVGPKIDDPVRLDLAEVERTRDGLAGEVIHVDHFGNLVTNIEADMLDRSISKIVVRQTELSGIARFFSQVQVGRPLALINSFGYLEISVNRGHASSVLGVTRGESVRVLWA